MSGVPCALPFSGIALLQLVRKGDVKNYHGFGLFEDTRVLVNPGNPADTLQKCFVKNKWVFEELNHVDEGQTCIMPCGVDIDLKCHASLTAGLRRSNWLRASLLNDGYEVDINQTWDLTIAGYVRKRAAAATQLESIVHHARIGWFSGDVIGVVTAVYVITGGLSYTGRVRVVIQGGEKMVAQARNNTALESIAELETQARKKNALEGMPKLKGHASNKYSDTTKVSLAPSPGWNFTVEGNGQIVLTENDPVHWIVAIEYLNLKPFIAKVKHKVKRNDKNIANHTIKHLIKH